MVSFGDKGVGFMMRFGQVLSVVRDARHARVRFPTLGVTIACLAVAAIVVPALGAAPQSAEACPRFDVQRACGWVIGWSTPGDGYGVILHTANGGKRWVRQGSVGTVPDVGLEDVKAVDRQVAWVVGQANGGYGVILRTHDGGRTWRRQGKPGVVPDGPMFGLGVVDAKTAWVVGASGTILRTRDRGRTWTGQVSGTTANLYAVAVVDCKTAWIIGDTDNGYAVVLHTDNGGRTWQRQGTAATIGARAFIDVSAASTRVAWAVGTESYIVKTSDGGASWQIQKGAASDIPHHNGVCAVGRNTAWTATDYNAAWRTTDGGANWILHGVPSQPTGYLLGVSAPTRDMAWEVGGAVYIGPSSPDWGVIVFTDDGGETWQTQSTPVSVKFRRVSFVGSRK